MTASRAAALVSPDDDFLASVLEGLSRPRKSLPCRFFYDETGSALFEEITRQPEYYLTRVETALLDAHAARMLGAETVLVEFGSGASVKTEILLRQARGLYAYAPVDICESFLAASARRLQGRFPDLPIRPLPADFSHPIHLSADLAERGKLGFFLGSTIGNFAPPEATRLLRAMRETLAPQGRLIVGVDLRKDAQRLLAAYDDAQGVTAAFNLNLLSRINSEIGADFDLSAFRHQAVYDADEGRVEMRLVSLRDQRARVRDGRFDFARGETIHTENAYKFTIEGFRDIARAAGWTPGRVWTDEMRLFSIHELHASL